MLWLAVCWLLLEGGLTGNVDGTEIGLVMITVVDPDVCPDVVDDVGVTVTAGAGGGGGTAQVPSA